MSKTKYTSYRIKGFTLIELLVVISIIAILMSILMPALQSARNQAKNVVCQSNMRQIVFSMTMYLEDNNSKLKPAPSAWGYGNDDFWWRNWTLAYGPYMEKDYSHEKKYDMKGFWCPAFKAELTEGNDGPTGPPEPQWSWQATSYWYGDKAVGYPKSNDRAGLMSEQKPYKIDHYYGNKGWHVLREQGYFHKGHTAMNLGYLEGHVDVMDEEDWGFWYDRD